MKESRQERGTLSAEGGRGTLSEGAGGAAHGSAQRALSSRPRAYRHPRCDALAGLGAALARAGISLTRDVCSSIKLCHVSDSGTVVTDADLIEKLEGGIRAAL